MCLCCISVFFGNLLCVVHVCTGGGAIFLLFWCVFIYRSFITETVRDINQRNRLAHEILTTEITYVESLEVVTEVCLYGMDGWMYVCMYVCMYVS